MLVNCQQSCGVCPGAERVTLSPTTPKLIGTNMIIFILREVIPGVFVKDYLDIYSFQFISLCVCF